MASPHDGAPSGAQLLRRAARPGDLSHPSLMPSFPSSVTAVPHNSLPTVSTSLLTCLQRILLWAAPSLGQGSFLKHPYSQGRKRHA